MPSKVFLIRADRLAKLRCNYDLISRQQTESSMPFNINNLTLRRLSLRNVSKALADAETKHPNVFCPQQVSECKLERLEMVKEGLN